MFKLGKYVTVPRSTKKWASHVLSLGYLWFNEYKYDWKTGDLAALFWQLEEYLLSLEGFTKRCAQNSLKTHQRISWKTAKHNKRKLKTELSCLLSRQSSAFMEYVQKSFKERFKSPKWISLEHMFFRTFSRTPITKQSCLYYVSS